MRSKANFRFSALLKLSNICSRIYFEALRRYTKDNHRRCESSREKIDICVWRRADEWLIASDIPVLVCNAHIPSTRIEVPSREKRVARAVKRHKGAKRRRCRYARRERNQRHSLPPKADTIAVTLPSAPVTPVRFAGEEAGLPEYDGAPVI